MAADLTPSGSTALAIADVARDTTARPVTWLIDNADAYRVLIAACSTAQTSISITQLAFDADCVAYRPDDVAATPAEPESVRIADVLLDAAGRGVDVRILLNASLLLDTATPLRRHFAAAGADPARLRVRGISRFPQLLHAKIVVVDEAVAFLIGSPFANGYWDDSHHEPIDVRRPQRELGGRPLHDLSIQFRGAPVAQLSSTFVALWNSADDVAPGDDEQLAADASPPGDGIEILRSAPHPRHARHSPERCEILRPLLAAIASARSLIYIEHQYLSSIAVIEALASALRREAALEVIIVLNQNPDVTAYRGWQNRRLGASGLFDHPRVGIFSLWTLGRDGGAATINQIFVHSKVVLVDDRWAMVGSANLDGVSLSTYGDDFSGRLGQRVFRGVRNFDVAAVLSGAPELPWVASVRELRAGLWREHLDAPDMEVSTVPPSGWLGHWRRRAQSNVELLSTLPALEGAESRILCLPYSRMSTPRQQLGSVGVPFANHQPRVSFDPSWVEVHLSPNWVRNIFA